MQFKNLVLAVSFMGFVCLAQHKGHAEEVRLYVKEGEMAALSDEIVKKLAKQKFQGIVAVTRGGLAPAGYLAQRLKIRKIEALGLSSYDDGSTQQKVLTVEKPLQLDNQGEGWLIVDDIADTGKTFEYIRTLFPKAHRVAYFVKAKGKEFTDSYAQEVHEDTWVVFPWEVD